MPGQAIVRASEASCGTKWSNGDAVDGGTLNSAVFAQAKMAPENDKNFRPLLALNIMI